MGESMGGIDLTGAFDSNPIPTLILEGRWDLTWSEAKPAILHGNHPQATLVMFENAGHGIYDEETDRFFGVLEDFVRNLPEVSPPAITAYKSTLAVWDEERTAAPEYALRSAGWGWNSSRELAAGYSRDWLEEFDEARSFLRLGFALYDVEDYDEARIVFERMESIAAAAGDPGYEAVALIWQGHMLDLMDRRDEAILAYRRVVDMNLEDTWSHGQYGLSYSLSPYSRERIESPFKRIDNRDSS
jgi:tetratricopeptide (TPR) repeat protein